MTTYIGRNVAEPDCASKAVDGITRGVACTLTFSTRRGCDRSDVVRKSHLN